MRLQDEIEKLYDNCKHDVIDVIMMLLLGVVVVAVAYWWIILLAVFIGCALS